MDKYVGKWEQTATDNVEGFLKATNVDEQKIQETLKMMKASLFETIAVTGTDVTITHQMAGGESQVKKGTLGQEVDFTYKSGNSCKMTFTMENGDLVEKLLGGHTTRTVRKVDGTTMTHLMTANGVTATRTFKKA